MFQIDPFWAMTKLLWSESLRNIGVAMIIMNIYVLVFNFPYLP
jgi:hypothetical protein